MNNACIRCLLHESGENDVLTDINKRIEKIEPGARTAPEIYALRLSKCLSCEHLLSGVCMKCGCYPELRAAYKKMKCPDTQGNKWLNL